MTQYDLKEAISAVERLFRGTSKWSTDEWETLAERMGRINISAEQAVAVLRQHRAEATYSTPTMPTLLKRLAEAAQERVDTGTGEVYQAEAPVGPLPISGLERELWARYLDSPRSAVFGRMERKGILAPFLERMRGEPADPKWCPKLDAKGEIVVEKHPLATGLAGRRVVVSEHRTQNLARGRGEEGK